MQNKLYTGEGESLMVLIDFRDPAQRRAFYAHKSAFKGRTHTEVVYASFHCLHIRPKGERLQS